MSNQMVHNQIVEITAMNNAYTQNDLLMRMMINSTEGKKTQSYSTKTLAHALLIILYIIKQAGKI